MKYCYYTYYAHLIFLFKISDIKPIIFTDLLK